ncbi:MAG: transcription-repair coupling factor [Neisseriales bacterium]|nr:MAG: transcription-repair coupling factor [Neisseriales bacterium]
MSEQPFRRSKHQKILKVASDSLTIARLASADQLLVVLTKNARTAKRLVKEIAYFVPDIPIAYFPDWETLPYDHFSAHIDLISTRLMTLWQVRQRLIKIIVLTVNTALMRLLPLDYLMGRTFFLEVGQTLHMSRLCQDLVASGYHQVSQVVAHGEFAKRGGIIDLYPIGADLPYRIDLFDDQIETLCPFDPDTQKTITHVEKLHLLPAKEYPTDALAIHYFGERYLATLGSHHQNDRLYQNVAKGIWPAGIEYYLPLFFEKTATLFDYIGQRAHIVSLENAFSAVTTWWHDINRFYHIAQSDMDRPILPPDRLYITPDEWDQHLLSYPCQSIAVKPSAIPDMAITSHAKTSLATLKTFLDTFSGKVLITSKSVGRLETLKQLLKEATLAVMNIDSWSAFIAGHDALYIAQTPLVESFVDKNIAVITEAILYQHYAHYVQHSDSDKVARNIIDPASRDLSAIHVGDKVVHEEYGIGCYQGLKLIKAGEATAEMMEILYANAAKLYVPVSQLQFISRYMGQDANQVALNQLGHAGWAKTKAKALEAVRDTAAELLALYAARMARTGHTLTLSEKDYRAFIAGFPFEETPDQLSAVQAVINDMCSSKPMDRLICGDVGFGKTEVALRATFIAVMNGYQVCVLVPTTLLAEQHYQVFCDRFTAWPVRITELSRFRSKKVTHQALLDLAHGTIDIAIGTHRLLQSDVVFKNLGLVIIDEEHRFGVHQKETLKRLRANVDVLTLTATPIPRTLSMALEGLRDFSMITTAPNQRLAVKTFVSPMSQGIIQEAVLREVRRGGQVFFLYNEVQRINAMYENLIRWLPNIQIGIAHGQMHEKSLETVMRDFVQQRYAVLLCSTIIETGIDVPNANTIIVHRADRFGLAQLHQLRGRVGRSHHQAYAYLLVPDEITADAAKRLEAIQLSDELGAGFSLAMQDLEIRGAGAVLGEQQSGDMQAIGYTLYHAMLKRAVALLKQGKTLDIDNPLHTHIDVNLHYPALLPESYCPDIHERLVLYKRLASCESEKAINSIHEELIDRFGLLPEPAQALLENCRIGQMAKPLGIIKFDATEQRLTIQFSAKPAIDASRMVAWLQTQTHASLISADKLQIKIAMPRLVDRIDQSKQVLKALGA